MNTMTIRVVSEQVPDKEIGHRLLLGATLAIDGVSFADRFAVDPVGLAQCSFETGAFFPLSCACGSPGCAGLTKPVHVHHIDGTTVWNIVEPEPVRVLSFDTASIRESVREALHEAWRQAVEAPHAATWFAGQSAKGELRGALTIAGLHVA